MKVFVLLSSILVAVLHWKLAHGYASGAPEKACKDMVPQHGSNEQSHSTFPYAVILDKKSIKSSDSVKVTIDGKGQRFMGFFIQGRVGDTPIGKFTAKTNVQLVDCEGVGTAATHTGPEPKDSITVDWKPPNLLSETVKFRVTVVANGSTYWVAYPSDPLSVV